MLFRFGFYYLEPLTAPTVLSRPDYNPPASPYTPSTDPCSVIIGDYNVENMSPKVAHLPVVASHIVNNLKTPDIMFLQEIQDDNGEGNDGTVSSNLTLSTLVNAITAAGASFNYSYTYVLPVDGQDGGVPGGNIRPAYLYNPAKVTLVPGSPVGGPLDANQVVTDASGNVGLKYENPPQVMPFDADTVSDITQAVSIPRTPRGILPASLLSQTGKLYLANASSPSTYTMPPRAGVPPAKATLVPP